MVSIMSTSAPPAVIPSPALANRPERLGDGALHATRNDLPEASRREAIRLLNQRLADCVALQSQCLQAHWNVRGMSFAALHLLFEQIAADVAECADLVAERVVQLGGLAEGTVAVAAARATLEPYPLAITSGAEHAAAVASAIAAFARTTRVGIEEMTELRDAVSADILTDVTRRMDRRLWMVEAHA